MKNKAVNTLKWMAKEYDFNTKEIYEFNVLEYMLPKIKEFKRKSNDISEFSKLLKSEMMYHYWSKCEHELIVEITDNNRVILRPFIGDESVCLDVSDETEFNWMEFANIHIKKQIFKTKAKIDVYDQLKYKWDEFVDYCWYTHLPYERKYPKFEKGDL